MNTGGKVQKQEISRYILRQYRGLFAVDAWGEESYFYNPDGQLPRGVYFATLKNKDGDNDKASNLDRDSVFRLNFDISKITFEKVLGERPTRPSAGGVVNTGHDFTRLNTLLAHPVYAWMAWVCVLNPETDMLRDLAPLLNESY
jgi:hypothetical protein